MSCLFLPFYTCLLHNSFLHCFPLYGFHILRGSATCSFHFLPLLFRLFLDHLESCFFHPSHLHLSENIWLHFHFLAEFHQALLNINYEKPRQQCSFKSGVRVFCFTTLTVLLLQAARKTLADQWKASKAIPNAPWTIKRWLSAKTEVGSISIVSIKGHFSKSKLSCRRECNTLPIPRLEMGNAILGMLGREKSVEKSKCELRVEYHEIWCMSWP